MGNRSNSIYKFKLAAKRPVNAAWEAAAEAAVQATLPPVAGLCDATSDEQHIAVLSEATRVQHDAFVEMHGDCLAVERRACPRESMPVVLAGKYSLKTLLTE